MIRLPAAVVLPLLLFSCATPPAGPSERFVPAPPEPPRGAPRLWPSNPPPGCPFPPSETLRGIVFTGRKASYTGADTWYPSWASDGAMYSSWTDGSVDGLRCSSAGPNAATGHARILGDDPLNLKIVDAGVFKSSPLPYAGRYPCGSLVHNGIWYYGTYCLHPAGRVPRDGIPYNWPWLGPFVGFRLSTDYGKTWTETPCTPAKPLFGESALNGEPVRFGAPHFVDLGRNLEHSPDGKAYLVAHGASDGTGRRFAYNSWITGDEIRLARVSPSPRTMNDASQYEFFAGRDPSGADAWSSDLSRSRPIAAWRDNMGCVTMTYDAPLRKFLLCVTDGGNTVHYFHTYLLESDRMTGPWKLVAYLRRFGEQAYFVNIPSKFISPDGRTMWLCYAANFSSGWGGVKFRGNPPGSRYALCLQEIRIPGPGDPLPPASPLEESGNAATWADVAASSCSKDSSPAALTDGVIDGLPGDAGREWASNGQREGAFVRLAWPSPVAIDRVWLFDRPNSSDQITSGTLSFSDGTEIATGALPDDAKQGLEVRFPPKAVTWMKFTVTGVREGTRSAGLSEIAVFRTR